MSVIMMLVITVIMLFLMVTLLIMSGGGDERFYRPGHPVGSPAHEDCSGRQGTDASQRPPAHLTGVERTGDRQSHQRRCRQPLT